MIRRTGGKVKWKAGGEVKQDYNPSGKYHVKLVSMKGKSKVLQSVGVFIFLLVLALTLGDVSNISMEPIWEKNAHSITSGWHLFIDGNLFDSDFHLPTVFRGEDLTEKEVRLTYTFQEAEIASQSLMFRTSQKSVTVLYDGEEIYNFDANIDARRIKVYGYINHFVRIPSAMKGSKLDIITVGHSKKSSNTFYPVYLGTRVSQIVGLFSYDGLSLIFGLIILTTAISIFIMAVTLLRHLEVLKSAFAFAGIEFCAGLWIISGSMSTQLIVHNQLILLVSGILAMFLLPYFLTHFVVSMYHIRESKILKKIVLLFPFTFIIISILQLLSVTNYHMFLTPAAIALFLYLIFLVTCAIKAFLNGNLAIKQFLIAITALLLSVLGELILLLLPFATLVNALILNVGILAFGAILLQQVLVLIMRYVERKGKEEYLLSLAHTDDLTGLANRRAFEERMENLRNSNLESSSVGIMVFDVNNLKILNDLKGHVAGDMLLRNVASLLEKWVAGVGEVFRIGGDEFAIICDPCDNEHYEELKNIIACDEATQSSKTTNLSFAYGEAIYSKTDAYASIDEAFAAADAEMYRHKAEMKRESVR